MNGMGAVQHQSITELSTDALQIKNYKSHPPTAHRSNDY